MICFFFTHEVKDWLATNLKGRLQITFEAYQTLLDWSVVFLVGCWLIWKWRCKQVFEPNFCPPPLPANAILCYAKDMSSSHSFILASRAKELVSIAWEPPRESWCKLNIDDSFKATSNSATYGRVLCNSSSVWLCGFVANLDNGCSVLAEVWGLFHGLQLAFNSGCKKLIVESDSNVVID